MDATDSRTEILNSWKEVATYMGRGVRTVQRWERELGLPVRRPRAKSRSAVIAFKPELDKWLHDAPVEQLSHEHLEPPPLKYTQYERRARLHNSTALLISRTTILLAHSSNLCEKLTSLRKKMEHTVKLTTTNVERSAKSLGVNLPTPRTMRFYSP